MNVLFLTKYDVCYGGIAAVLGGLSSALAAEGVNVLAYSNHESAAAGKLPCGTPSPPGHNMTQSSGAPRRSREANFQQLGEQE